MYSAGIDIGGTFTDFALLDAEQRVVALHKKLTTPRRPAEALVSGFAEICLDAEIPAASVTEIVHGTTLVTNSVIERKGARTGMLVTAGFADILDMGYEKRYDLFDLNLSFPEPVVPRFLRREIRERTAADGRVVTPLDAGAVVEAVAALRAEGVQSIAICFLNSYANREHEHAAKALVEEIASDIFVSCSSDVLPQIREYDRWVTTCVNAYARPLVSSYLGEVRQGLQRTGFDGRLYIMTSSGAKVAPEVADAYPVRLIESGPAAGIITAPSAVDGCAAERVLSFDIGGTTAKGAFVVQQRPLKKYTLEVARENEQKRGSGLPLTIPVIDMVEIGSGGGSIARLDRRGMLKVGPVSAGADPGPACYGRGGVEPTLTDANLLLGIIGHDRFMGGEMALDAEAAQTAIASGIAGPAGLSEHEAAWGIHETVNEDIARSFRMHAAERGLDQRGFTLVAFGGCGPIHAVAVARKLRARRVVVPAGAGVLSAIGLLKAPLAFETKRTAQVALAALGPGSYRRFVLPLLREAESAASAGAGDGPPPAITVKLDMRYVGQGYEVEVDASDLAELDPALLKERFEAAYRNVFSGFTLDNDIEVVSWKVESSESREPGALRPPPPTAAPWPRNLPSPPDGSADSRAVYLGRRRIQVPVPVHRRADLPEGWSVRGPVILEDRECTIFVDGEELVRKDPAGSIIVDMLTGAEEGIQ